LPGPSSMSRADDLQERTDALADRSIAVVEALPPTMVVQRLARHYLDASTSVAATIGPRVMVAPTQSSRPRSVVAEEADESVFWLNRIEKALAATGVAIEPLLAEAEETRSNLQRRRADARYRRGRK
jgi:hypothetical protein